MVSAALDDREKIGLRGRLGHDEQIGAGRLRSVAAALVEALFLFAAGGELLFELIVLLLSFDGPVQLVGQFGECQLRRIARQFWSQALAERSDLRFELSDTRVHCLNARFLVRQAIQFDPCRREPLDDGASQLGSPVGRKIQPREQRLPPGTPGA